MPAWLLTVLERMTVSGIARGEKGRVTRARLRNRFHQEMGRDFTAKDAARVYDKVLRREQAAARLMASGGQSPTRQYLPRCPHLNQGEPRYHATVYITFETEAGQSCGRFPVYVDFDEPLSAQEIIDVAIDQATDAIQSGSPGTGGVSGAPGRACEPVEDSASLSQLCYG